MEAALQVLTELAGQGVQGPGGPGFPRLHAGLTSCVLVLRPREGRNGAAQLRRGSGGPSCPKLCRCCPCHRFGVLSAALDELRSAILNMACNVGAL